LSSLKVEPGTCLQKLVGSVRTGVILKDVSLEVHGGELTAVLGSKGTGSCKQVRRGLVSFSRTSPWRSMAGSSPPSLAPKVLELYVGSARSCVIPKDVSLEVHGRELTAVLGSKGTGTLCRFGQALCHPQGRLPGGSWRGAHRRPWLKGTGT
jgi:ABC-type transporter Mla maintaining outer membrane lipid asymmetry ATPase subunit MlaF